MIIHLAPLTALDDALRQRYRDTLLDDDERMRLAQFKRDIAADQFLLGRALLRTTFAALLQREPIGLTLDRNADGKPALRDGDGWHFNLSHSRDWVALALSRDGEVGVDIETSARRNDIDGIAQRFFQPQEAQQLLTLDEATRRRHFFTMWTVKEAAVKALGCGIAGALPDVGVQIDEDVPTLLLGGALTPAIAPQCWHRQLQQCGALTSHLAAVLLPERVASAPLHPQLWQTLPLQYSRRIP